MSSSGPPSPSVGPGPGLSPEEKAEHELLKMMSSPLPTGDFGDNDEVDELALDSEDIPSNISTTPPSISAAGLRNELIVLRRKAAQNKLHPYQREAVEEFVKGSSVFQRAMTFIQLCSVENTIAGIKSAAPPFVCSPQLIENIKSFVVAVLLSSKLSAYKKDSVPVGHVMQILTSVPRSYIPENLSGDSYALKVVKASIQEELTQARARIKKAIRDSLASESPDSIFDLATAVVANSKSLVTVPLCARIALLRKIYVEYPNGTFWDKVDVRLELIRSMAGGTAWKITKAFECILQADCSTYGNSTTYILPDSTNDAFQSSVDDAIVDGSTRD